MESNPTVARAVEAINARFSSADHSLTSIVDLATLVANADGVIDDQELEALTDWLSRLLGEALGPDGIRSLIRSSLVMINVTGADVRAQMIANAVAACGVVDEALTLALAVGFASDGLSAPERAVVERVAAAAGVGPERLEVLVQRVEASFRKRPSVWPGG